MSSTSPVYDFSGRRVLITGGGRGIGRAILEKFYASKASLVVVLERDEILLQDLVRDFPRVHGIRVDLSDWEATRKAVEAVAPIHHLVNNAANGESCPFMLMDEAHIDRVFQVNYKALVNISQRMVQGLIEKNETQGATIVNISSITDSMAIAQLSSYASTKAAITMMTKIMAVELAPHQIRVNCVRPGGVDTEMLKAGRDSQVLPPLDIMLQGPLFNKLVTPEEVAQAVVFLSSGASSAINGTSLCVDSGIELR